MSESRTTIPEATCGRWVDATPLVEMRPALEASAGIRVTPFSMIARFTVLALLENPALNAAFDAEAAVIRQYGAVHLGVATATERGLVVAVVRSAHERTLVELAAEIDRLAEGARAGSLAPAELTGSTFTISNFGAFGLDDGNPVINHPEAAILGVGALEARPWVVDGTLAVRHTVKLTCAFDHRVADGADAGAFLGRLASLLEQPGQLLANV
jgi:pyruvate dehydrogenase E2 component (dihydrolipoamide acetyltransferase)